MRVECPDCRGQRRLYYLQMPEPEPIRELAPFTASSEMTVTKTLEDCRTCGGAGYVAMTDRVPVFQCGRKVGTVPPDFDPLRIRSTNWLYDARPDDFRQEGLTWVASRTLGPGDLEAVPGFVWDRE